MKENYVICTNQEPKKFERRKLEDLITYRVYGNRRDLVEKMRKAGYHVIIAFSLKRLLEVRKMHLTEFLFHYRNSSKDLFEYLTKINLMSIYKSFDVSEIPTNFVS